MNSSLRRRNGMTLMEILMVVVIIGILAAIAFAALTPTWKSLETKAYANEFAGALRGARMRTISKGVMHAVAFVYNSSNSGSVSNWQIFNDRDPVITDGYMILEGNAPQWNVPGTMDLEMILSGFEWSYSDLNDFETKSINKSSGTMLVNTHIYSFKQMNSSGNFDTLTDGWYGLYFSTMGNVYTGRIYTAGSGKVVISVVESPAFRFEFGDLDFYDNNGQRMPLDGAPYTKFTVEITSATGKVKVFNGWTDAPDGG